MEEQEKEVEVIDLGELLGNIGWRLLKNSCLEQGVPIDDIPELQNLTEEEIKED